MQPKTRVALIAFIGLLATVFFLENAPEAPPAKRVTLPGFVPEGQVVAKASSDLVDPGFTRILLERPDETLEIQKKGDTWMLTKPRESNVEQFKVKQMLLPLQTPTESLITQTVGEADLRIYGLDPASAIRVSLFQGDTVYASFVAGGRQKSDTPDAPTELVDTWIGTEATDAGMTVSRMGDKDLHTPYAIALKDLRSKKLFSFSRDDVTGITIENPLNPHPRIVLERQGEGDKSTWAIQEPAGFDAGDTSALVGALVNLRAADFVPADDGTTKGLDDSDQPAQVTIALGDTSPIVLRIGAERDTRRFATVQGSDEIVELAAYNANNLLKSIGDLRNKKVLGIQGEQVTRVEFQTDGVVLAKQPSGKWRIEKPLGIAAGSKAIEALLKDLESWSVTDFERLEKRSERGLDEKSAPSSVRIHEASGRITHLLISDIRDKVHWAMPASASQNPEMWRLTSFMAKKLIDRSADDFRKKEVFGLKRDDIQSLTLKHASETVVITPGEGEAPWRVQRGDEVLTTPKSAEISKTMTSLASLVAKSFIARDPGAQITGLGGDAFTAEFKLSDGTRHSVEISDQKFADNEVYARTSSASGWKGQLFTVNRFQAENIQRKFKHFK